MPKSRKPVDPDEGRRRLNAAREAAQHMDGMLRSVMVAALDHYEQAIVELEDVERAVRRMA